MMIVVMLMLQARDSFEAFISSFDLSIRDCSLFIGITGSGKFNWDFSRFSWPVQNVQSPYQLL